MFASHMIAIKSTLNWSETTCNETTLWINWTPFEMADELPSCNCWFSSQQSVYMASNPKKKCKSWLNIVKNHLGRANFVLFSNLFHPVVSKLKQDSCHKVHASLYIYTVSFSYFFHFLLFMSRLNVKFCHKNFPLLIVFHYLWTQNGKSVTDEIWNSGACTIKSLCKWLLAF